MGTRPYCCDVFGAMVPCDAESAGIPNVRKFVIMHRKALGIEIEDMARFEADDDCLAEYVREFEDGQGETDGVASLLAYVINEEVDDILVESCRGYDRSDACVGIVGETVFPWTCRNAYAFHDGMAGLTEGRAVEVILGYVGEIVPDAKCDRHEIERYG